MLGILKPWLPESIHTFGKKCFPEDRFLAFCLKPFLEQRSKAIVQEDHPCPGHAFLFLDIVNRHHRDLSLVFFVVTAIVTEVEGAEGPMHSVMNPQSHDIVFVFKRLVFHSFRKPPRATQLTPANFAPHCVSYCGFIGASRCGSWIWGRY